MNKFDHTQDVAPYVTMNKILNFSELSRYITGGDRNCIRPNKVPKKHIKAIDKLINEELPKWWELMKAEPSKK